MPNTQEAIDSAIDRIHKMGTERQYLLAQLELWARAKLQGVDPEETTGVFGFDSRLLDEIDKADFRRNPRNWVDRDATGAVIIRRVNFVRMKSGEQRKLQPALDNPRRVV